MSESLLGEASIADWMGGIAIICVALALVVQDVWQLLFGPRQRPTLRVTFSSNIDL